MPLRIVSLPSNTTPLDHPSFTLCANFVQADCQALIQKGILHTNTYGVGSPSQPNYIAPGSGDTFGLNSDSFVLVDKNVSTVVDLLEDKAISWGDYNEGLPYTGFQGVSHIPIERVFSMI